MRGERAGIGFIGLLLQIAEGYFEHTFEAVSEACFGEEEVTVIASSDCFGEEVRL